MQIGCRLLVVLVAVAVAGCNTPLRRCRSPLAPAQMSPDSVVLEMFFVRVPLGDAAVNEKLWAEVDEQQFSPELRERLTRNGFRVGLVSEPMPATLCELLQLADKPAPNGDLEGSKVEDFESQPKVVRRHLPIRTGQRGEILASGIYPQLPVLVSESGQLTGQTYAQAQGVLAVRWFPQPDSRVRLELVPELQHDQPRQHWVGNQGILRLEASRPKRKFDDMTITADLMPGAMLVMTSLSNRSGSLGHHFFTENTNGRLEQKMLLVRLAQTQRDNLFDAEPPLNLDEVESVKEPGAPKTAVKTRDKPRNTADKSAG
jgi:hypothetical protein